MSAPERTPEGSVASPPAGLRGVQRLEDFADVPDDAIDVAVGAALIARDVYGGLDVRAVLAKLDELAAPLLREEGGEGLVRLSVEEQAARLSGHVFGTLGFRGNEKDYYDPRNSLLPDVLERRLGIPISLALVYCEVAKRAGVPAHGIGFPGHFLVRLERPGKPEAMPLVIDPFYGGRILDEVALRRMLERAMGPEAALTPEHLAAATPRAVLVRMLTNLKAIYLQRGDHARAHLALDRVVSLAPSARNQLVNALKERGLVAAKLGANEAARADLARVLELAPDSSDAAALRVQLAKLNSSAKSRALN
jgi:regulator of sirC expression with transglutaminase-like and TPR domain